jgi:hypothetical protein
MLNRFAITILATAILISPVNAQIRGSGVTPGAMGTGTTPGASGVGRSGFGLTGTAGSAEHGLVGGPTRFHRVHSSGRSGILLPYPYYYSDYGYDSEGAAQPQVVVVPAAPAQPALPASPLEPLLIEWQGDHFERMTLSQKTSAKERDGPDYSAKSEVRPSTPRSPSSGSSRPAQKVAAQLPRESARELPRDLPLAVLVFRDGRTEEVSSYTIMSGTIYSKADYWTSGSWTRKIQIADLDVPATLKLNQGRGLNFVLPASPNEVVMRP